MTTDIVDRLHAPKKAEQFNSAGVLERYEVEPTPLEIEAAAEILRLREAVAAEREACAALVANYDPDFSATHGMLDDIAAAIRARGQA